MGPIISLSEHLSAAPSEARRSAEASIALLEEAVKHAQHREAAVRQTVNAMLQDLREWEDRLSGMEAAIASAEARSVSAEHWLGEVHRSVRTFAQGVAGRADGAASGYAASGPSGWDLRLRASS